MKKLRTRHRGLLSRRRLTFIFYFIIFLFIFLLIAQRIYIHTITWTDADWEELRPDGGVVHYEHDYVVASDSGCSDSTLLLVIVFSRPQSISLRSTIRSTWLNQDFVGPQADSLVYKFILGNVEDPIIRSAIINESLQYGDIIIDQSYIDSYPLLILKTISMVQWVNTFCPKVTAVLKADDDTWFNIAFLLKLIPSLQPAIYGHVFHLAGSSRNPEDRWYMPKDVYPFKHYPDFTSGPGYLIVNKGDNIFAKLLGTISTVRSIWTEDVFLTGLVAEKAKIRRINVDGFNPTKFPTEDICQYLNIISSSDLDEATIDYIYNSLADSNSECYKD